MTTGMQEYGNFGIAINTNTAAQDPNTHNEHFLSPYLRLLQQYKDTKMPQEVTLFF